MTATITPLMPAVDLRPYQADALAAIEATRTKGNRSALVLLPTGTGKTVLFSSLVQRWNVPTLILAHREELLTQARDKLRSVWPDVDVGIVGAGFNEAGHRVTVGSVQTLSRPKRLQALASAGVQLVIVDEAHHSPARSYGRILQAVAAGQPHGAFLVGVTATPDRADRRSLDELYGAPVYAATLPDMVLAGWLCDLRGVQVRTSTRLDGVHTRAGDFREEELAAAVNRPDRNRVIVNAYTKHAAGRSALAFAANVQHAHDLAETFRASGISAAALDGTTPRHERQQMLADFAAGRVQVVCNCGVLTEGFDCPSASCVILARPTQSRALYVQMVGRGTRTAPGKADCLVIDVADVTARHNLTVMSLPKIAGRGGYNPRQEVAAIRTAAGTSGATGTSGERPADAPFSLKAALTGELVEQSVGLLTNRYDWKAQGDGSYRLQLPRQRVTFLLTLHETGYRAVLTWPDGRAQSLTPQPVSLDWAQAVAERAAKQIDHGQARLVDNRAPWRRQPATEKQLWRLRKLRIPVSPYITKGEAAELIGQAMERQTRGA